MPRDVVPIFRSPRRASDSTSSSRWYGRMTCAFSLTSSRPSTATPSRASSSTSLNSACGIDHHAVADDARDAGMQDAGRNQVQDELLAVHVDGVPGVVAALVARDRREVRRQQVDDLALAFVAPLRAEHGDIRGCSPFSTYRMRNMRDDSRARVTDAVRLNLTEWQARVDISTVIFFSYKLHLTSPPLVLTF